MHKTSYIDNNEINELELINAVLCQWYYLHTLWASTLSSLRTINALLLATITPQWLAKAKISLAEVSQLKMICIFIAGIMIIF